MRDGREREEALLKELAELEKKLKASEERSDLQKKERDDRTIKESNATMERLNLEIEKRQTELAQKRKEAEQPQQESKKRHHTSPEDKMKKEQKKGVPQRKDNRDSRHNEPKQPAVVDELPTFKTSQSWNIVTKGDVVLNNIRARVNSNERLSQFLDKYAAKIKNKIATLTDKMRDSHSTVFVEDKRNKISILSNLLDEIKHSKGWGDTTPANFLIKFDEILEKEKKIPYRGDTPTFFNPVSETHKLLMEMKRDLFKTFPELKEQRPEFAPRLRGS